MGFAESFVECMSGGGIQIDAGAVPQDANTFRSIVNYVQSAVQEFGDYHEDFDAATADAGSQVVMSLSHPEVGAIDPGYDGLLQAFDQASGFPLSTCLQWSTHCIEEAEAAAAQGDAAQGTDYGQGADPNAGYDPNQA
jgi:hypothetical protein